MQGSAGPPLAALFLVTFDQKIGYTLTWQKSLPGIKLDGVEFRALPSGLHELESDLVYFSHGDYVGVSAFKRSSAGAEQRNATFASVGALVERSGGRLGGIWKHSKILQDLARTIVHEENSSSILERYWNDHQAQRKTTSPKDTNLEGTQSIEDDVDLTQAGSNQKDTSMHPITAITDLLHRFGPLIFPLHRAALLRRRILLLGHPPMQQLCNFVYNTTLLASHSSASLQKIKRAEGQLPVYDLLFNVGIADIDQLADLSTFIACTSDSILADKSSLYDVVAKMPQTSTKSTAWPSLFDSTGKQIKATHRDVDRFNFLVSGLHIRRSHSMSEPHQPEELDVTDDAGEEEPLMPTRTTDSTSEHTRSDFPRELLETKTWTTTAYEKLSRWSNADSKEADVDTDVTSRQSVPNLDGLRSAIPADVLTALNYFVSMNSHHVKMVDAILTEHDEQASDTSGPIISPSSVEGFGLDAYSAADRAFVEDIFLLYSGRTAQVVDDGVRLCGLRIC